LSDAVNELLFPETQKARKGGTKLTRELSEDGGVTNKEKVLARRR